MRKKVDKTISKVAILFGSAKFFWIVVGIFLFQSIWIALSFRHALLYDERYHYMLTQLFADHYWPIITNQPSEYDFFSNISRSGSYAYHYLMSFPYRLVESITDSKSLPILFLRLMNITLFAAGIIVFSKLFKLLKIHQIYINIGLLFFILLPIVPFVAAHINYDNAIFLLTSLFFYFSVKIINNRKICINDLLLLLVISFFGVLVKFSFAAIVVPGLIALFAILLKRHGHKILKNLKTGYRKTNKRVFTFISVMLGITIIWLGNIYLINFIQYGDPTPSCEATMSVERCEANSNNNRSQRLYDTRNERDRVPIPRFSMLWFENLMTNVSWTGVRHTRLPKDVADPFPIFNTTLMIAIFLSIIAISVAWKNRLNYTSYKYIFGIIAFYITSLYIQNMLTYNKVHLLVAVQPRYLIPIALMIIVISTVSLSYMLGRNRIFKMIVLVVFLLGMLNGGGLAPHVLRSQDSWYWENSFIIEINNKAKDVLDPLVTGGDRVCYEAGRYSCD